MHWRWTMVDETGEDALDASMEHASRLLREEVPVRSQWREELLARIESDGRAHRRGWTMRPWMAMAAGLVLVAGGVVAGRVTARSSVATPVSPTTATVRFVYVAPGAAKVS